MDDLNMSLIAAGCLIFIVLLIAIPVFIHNGKLDKSCLEDKANSYCKENNYTYIGIGYRGGLYFDSSFICNRKLDERKDKYEYRDTFYYLKSEKEGCKK